MNTLTTTSDAALRLIQAGAGGMGRNWLRVIAANPSAELVGLVDLNTEVARAAATEAGFPDLPVGTSVSELAAATGAQAVINVTVPVAHHPVTVEALAAGLPVLCEKPAAPTVAQALSLAAHAEATGQLLMISQSRRYFRSLEQLRAVARDLGTVGVITTEFFKAPHFGGFREEMDHVLLVDMAIHPFDAVRYLSGQEPVSVYCEEYNPVWSWFRGNAAASAIFEFTGGLRYTYAGSWCSDGEETSWNGRWRVNGSEGTALWDGVDAPTVQRRGKVAGVVPEPSTEAEEIAGSLEEFLSALRTGSTPSGEIHSNIWSLAMVEAAVLSAETGSRVFLDDVMTAAYRQALEAERDPAAREALESWGSATKRLSVR
ncbi:Gfo/Idh/MocA family protein [Psychromicrobium xiongbiense]|uniref:Gfo/Idh/MocA family protein n=1 Tax=Psychromicrobium xiongbiense TaxID=3051184 RepID=UPI002555A231|nr:Gfo/Idh/MocA family oxidoreductase [Psychromicrobium sp. YIM S02556]